MQNDYLYETVQIDKTGQTANRHVSKERYRTLDAALVSGVELDDTSLLEAILLQHTHEDNARQLAGRLINRFKTIAGVLQCELRQLLQIEGLNLRMATAIFRMRQLIRAIACNRLKSGKLFAAHAEITEYCRTLLAHCEREEFHVLLFDRRGMLLAQDCLQRGTIDHVSVYPREVLRLVIQHNASFIILVHNHPVGKATPSSADLRMTSELNRLVSAIGASVYDHIIISKEDAFSFRQQHVSFRSLVASPFPLKPG